MRIIHEVITFDGGGAKALAQASAVSTPQQFASRVYVEPDDANTHKSYVGTSALDIGTSTVANVIKRLAKPTAADAVLDNFDVWAEGANGGLDLKQLKFDGTSGEKLRVTIYQK